MKGISMLVLRRRVGESVFLADGLIEVYVARIDATSVRLSIRAPDDVDIVRSELRAAEEQVQEVAGHE